jgi:cytidylate kinase
MMKANIGCKDIVKMQHFLEKNHPWNESDWKHFKISIDDEFFSERDLHPKNVNEMAASYSSIGEIRKILLTFERSQLHIARKNGFRGLAIEGRDLTSVIFPDATLRFFPEASAQERSLRRKNDCISERDEIGNRTTICRSNNNFIRDRSNFGQPARGLKITQLTRC